MSQQEFFGDDGRSQPFVEIDILEENIVYVHIFSHCQAELVGGFGSFLWRSIAASEIYAACQLMLIDREKWLDIFENVVFLGSEVSNRLNAKASR